MKLKPLLLMIITNLLMIFGTTTLAFASTYSGHLDGVTEAQISGWAWDISNPKDALNVHITVTNQATGRVVKELYAPASIPRSDVLADGRGTGDYGFLTPMDWSGIKDGIYVVDTYFDGSDQIFGSMIYNKGNVVPALSTSGMRSLGKFKSTAYCPCRSCSGRWGRQTSTGATAREAHTIAVDPSVVPYGTKLMINGTVYTAEDKGGGVNGKHIDIFFNSHNEAKQYGVKSIEVFLVP